MPKNSQSGQILLIVVLAAVISLTVGLSVASRVITNTKTTTDEINSQKALSAAEAGIEQALKNTPSTSTNTTFSNNSKVVVNPTQIAFSQFLVNGGNLISQDDGVDIWLSDHGPSTGKPTYANPRSTNLKIYWTGSNSDCTKNAALEIIVISGSTANPVLNRYAYDPCAATRGNGFSAPNSTAKPISQVSFDQAVVIPVTNGLIARVIPLYASTKIGVDLFAAGSTTLTLNSPPAQGYLLESTGTSGTVTRTLRVFQGYPKVPNEFFTYSLFIPSAK